MELAEGTKVTERAKVAATKLRGTLKDLDDEDGTTSGYVARNTSLVVSTETRVLMPDEVIAVIVDVIALPLIRPI